MIKTFCEWGIYDDNNNAKCLSEGDTVDSMNFTIHDATVTYISKDQITLENEDSRVTININDINSWD